MNPHLKILYGPPGTGKTWLAAREAIRAVDQGRYERILGGSGQDGFQNLHKRWFKTVVSFG